MDDSEPDEWNMDEKVLQEMKESYRQVRRKDRKSPGSHVNISDSEFLVSISNTLVVIVSVCSVIIAVSLYMTDCFHRSTGGVQCYFSYPNRFSFSFYLVLVFEKDIVLVFI